MTAMGQNTDHTAEQEIHLGFANLEHPQQNESPEGNTLVPPSSDIPQGRDTASVTVTLLVQGALIFFALLFFLAVAGSILFSGTFRLITSVTLVVLVAIVIGTIAWAVWEVNRSDKLQEMSWQLHRWGEVARAAVVEEVRNFQMDVREHRLLTYGEEYGQSNSNGEMMDENFPKAARESSGNNSRSVIFGAMIKPFLKGKRKKFGKMGLGQRNGSKSQHSEVRKCDENKSPGYVSPSFSNLQAEVV